jgi:hypothetical protein
VRKSRFNEEQIIGILKESEAGVPTVPTENSISVKKVKQSSCGKRIPRLPGRRSLLLPPKRQCVSFSA